MYNQIHNISSNWVNNQRNMLADSQLLLQGINSNLEEKIQVFTERLSALNARSQASFYKDHVFHNWLNEIKSKILSIYEKSEYPKGLERISNIIELLNLAVAVLSKLDYECVLDSGITSKFLLPVSGLYIDFNLISRNNQILYCKYHSNSTEIEIENVKYPFSKFKELESIKIADCNFDFFSDPTEDEYSINFDRDIDLPAWIATLGKSLDIIRTDKSSYELVTNFTSYLVPLKQKEAIKNLSFSVRNLPSVIFKNNELTPYLIGETLVHESDHQLFYAIERFVSFWKYDIKLQQPIYLSPWRDDPRPLDGILRGLSAFARVSQYYSTAISTYRFTEEQHEQVGLILLTRLRESEDALNTVLKSQQLSDFGLQYINEIQETLNSVTIVAKTFPQYERWNKNANDSLKRHKINCESINQIYV